MTTPATTFDDGMQRWRKEMALPWGRLKYALIHANLAKHIGPEPLRVLDAGGGDGQDAVPLAKLGHTVAIVDTSREMLDGAMYSATQAGVADLVSVHEADIRDAPELLAGAGFDLILCHNVVQYFDEPAPALAPLVSVLHAGGLISVVCGNRYSIPYHAAFLRGDLVGALELLDARGFRASIFDAHVAAYSVDEITDVLVDLGCTVVQDYGIRCICDYWGDNERKSDPDVFRRIEELEVALTDRYPYKLLARYVQVIARKT